MLWTASIFKGYVVAGIDGHVGTVSDLLFDDAGWKTRWLVANTRHWFPNREVLLPVSALGHPDLARQEFAVRLTMKQIHDCRHVARDLPVSRQAEVGLYDFGSGEPGEAGSRTDKGVVGIPSASPIDPAGCGSGAACAVDPSPRPADPHLRSMEAVIGHRVHAVDGLIGHVDDLLMDGSDWSVRYVKVDTRNWGPRRRVLLPPRLIRQIDWPSRLVHLNVDRQELLEWSRRDPAGRDDGRHGETLPTCDDIRWVKE